MKTSLLTYEFRLDFSDGFEIATVDAENYGHARSLLAARYPDAEGYTFLATVDHAPQYALAF